MFEAYAASAPMTMEISVTLTATTTLFQTKPGNGEPKSALSKFSSVGSTGRNVGGKA